MKVPNNQQQSELERKLDNILADLEIMCEQEFAREEMGRDDNSSDIGHARAKLALTTLIEEEKRLAEKRYFESVLRTWAKSDPDMTVSELYKGIFEQKHHYTGQQRNKALNPNNKERNDV